MAILAIPIVILLAVSGVWALGQAYQAGRAWGASTGAVWLLLAVFLAGSNHDSARDLAVAHPAYSLALFGVVFLLVFFAGPRSAFWQRSARFGPVRLVALRIRRVAYRSGGSRRLAGEVVAVAAALLVLLPISFLTQKPDSTHDYALNKLRRELPGRVADPASAIEAAVRAALDDLMAHGVLDDAANAAAFGRVAEEIKRINSQINRARMSPEQSAAWQAEIEAVSHGARESILTRGTPASREAVLAVAKKLLEAERPVFSDRARQTIAGSLPELIERGRLRMAGSPADTLKDLTPRLIDSLADEALKAAQEKTATDARRVLARKREEIELAGRNASRRIAEESASTAIAAMARALERHKSALDRAEDELMKREADARWKAALEREQQEKRRREEQQQHPVLRRRLQAMERFHRLEDTNFRGGTSLTLMNVEFIHECADACLIDGCDSFAMRKSAPHTCYRWKGRPESFGDQYFIGGRLR